jgi:hypothetical protein
MRKIVIASPVVAALAFGGFVAIVRWVNNHEYRNRN